MQDLGYTDSHADDHYDHLRTEHAEQSMYEASIALKHRTYCTTPHLSAPMWSKSQGRDSPRRIKMISVENSKTTADTPSMIIH